MRTLAKKSGTTPGDVVRYEPAPEPLVAAVAIGILTLIELAFSIGFLFILFTSGATFEGRHFTLMGTEFAYLGNTVEAQQVEALLLGGSIMTLAAILSLYRKFFLPDVMIVKKRKLKYEDLM